MAELNQRSELTAVIEVSGNANPPFIWPSAKADRCVTHAYSQDGGCNLKAKLFYKEVSMPGFWDEVLRGDNVNIPPKEIIDRIFSEVISEMPEYEHTMTYLKEGTEHLAEYYLDGDVDREHMTADGEKMITPDTEFKVCTIVDIAMIELVDHDHMLEFLRALKVFKETGGEDPTDLFTEFKELIHYVVHMAMGLGIGMALEEGTVEEVL